MLGWHVRSRPPALWCSQIVALYMCASVEGEVDRAVIPPLPGLLSKGSLRSSIFGKMPLVDIPPL